MDLVMWKRIAIKYYLIITFSFMSGFWASQHTQVYSTLIRQLNPTDDEFIRSGLVSLETALINDKSKRIAVIIVTKQNQYQLPLSYD